MRLELIGPDPGPVEVEVVPGETEVRWSVANPHAEDRPVRAVALVWRLLDVRAPLRMFRNGWQSWSPTDVVTVGEAADPSVADGSIEFVRDMHGADPAVAGPGELRSELVSVLADGGGEVVLVGFVGGAEHDGTIRLRPVDGGFELRAEATLGGAVLAAGEQRALHPVAVRTGERPDVLLADWAARFGAAEGARTGAPYQVGWCSWYHYFHRITEDTFRANIARAGEWPFDVFQLDDGYQAAIGDWLLTGESFPSGIEGVATAVADAGMTPGLWLAPFLADPDSGTARARPELFARRLDSDDPLVAMFNPEWGGFMWGLDTTLPEAQEWIAETVGALVDAGFDYLKLDFTFAPAVQGRFADPGATPAQRLRLGYDAVRRGAGDATFLLACGCPLGPVVGLVDGMRIGPDVAPSWARPPEADVLPGYEEAAPCTRSAWRSTLARSFMHRRLWLNDPDCVMLRTTETDLTPAEARAWALAVGVSGGMALVSDDLALLGPEERRLLDEVVALGRVADDASRSGPPPPVPRPAHRRLPHPPRVRRRHRGADPRRVVRDAHPVPSPFPGLKYCPEQVPRPREWGMASNTNLWPDREHALRYLAIADGIPHRTEGEGVLLDHLPEGVGRVLDLGTGDGRLLALVLATRPDVTGIGLDFSDEMLERAGQRFAGDDRVEIRRHDLNERLPDLGGFDAVVSSFAIHHVDDARKREVYAEAYAALAPGGVFLNLEHVASATDRLHEQFRVAIDHADQPDDPSNLLAPVEAQLGWLRDVGFEDVDCHWKWLELALLVGVRA